MRRLNWNPNGVMNSTAKRQKRAGRNMNGNITQEESGVGNGKTVVHMMKINKDDVQIF